MRKFQLPWVRLISVLLLAVSVLVLNTPALAQGMITASSTGTTTEKTSPSIQTAAPTTSSVQTAAPIRSGYPAAVEAARAALAARLRISIDSVKVVSYQYVTWRDSCLGIYYPHQSCLMVITPGYRVVLDVSGQQYIAHTDLTGKIIRWEAFTN